MWSRSGISVYIDDCRGFLCYQISCSPQIWNLSQGWFRGFTDRYDERKSGRNVGVSCQTNETPHLPGRIWGWAQKKSAAWWWWMVKSDWQKYDYRLWVEQYTSTAHSCSTIFDFREEARASKFRVGIVGSPWPKVAAQCRVVADVMAQALYPSGDCRFSH